MPKLFHDIDANGVQLKNAGLHRQATGDLPIVRGQLSFDDGAQQLRYSPDGVTWRYPTTASAAVVGAPTVVVKGLPSGWTTGCDGSSMNSMRGRAQLYAKEVPATFFTDPALDAGIDLYVYRPKGHKDGRYPRAWHRHGGWSHPVSFSGGLSEDAARMAAGIIPRPSRYRGATATPGGGPLGDRRTFWPLLGAAEGQMLEKDVNFAAFFRKATVQVFRDNFRTPSSIQQFATTFGHGGTNRSPVGGYNSKYNYSLVGAEHAQMYFAFAYSWRDLNHPDPRHRVVGPMSAVLRVAAWPWCVHRDQATNEPFAVEAKGLSVEHAD